MQCTILGSGSAMPVPDRMQSGYLLTAGDRTLLVDCGSGVLSRLSATEQGYESVSTVLLTHHHLDHVADLLPLLKARWLAGQEYLEVVGPAGTKALLDGLLGVHDYLNDRVDLAIREVSPAQSFTVAGFDVDSREVRHSLPHCHAYRIAPRKTSEGDTGTGDSNVNGARGTLTLSGDTEAFPGFATFAAGSEVVIHDCSFPDDVDVSGHPTPTSLGKVMAGSDVDTLLLTHLYPHTLGREREMVDRVREAGFEGTVRVAHDGLTIDIDT